MKPLYRVVEIKREEIQGIRCKHLTGAHRIVKCCAKKGQCTREKNPYMIGPFCWGFFWLGGKQ